MISKFRRKLFARRARKELCGIYEREQQGLMYQDDDLIITYIKARYHLDMRLAFPAKTKHSVASPPFSLAIACWHIAENDRRKEKIEAERAERRRAADMEALKSTLCDDPIERYARMIKLTGGGKWAEHLEEEKRRRGRLRLWP